MQIELVRHIETPIGRLALCADGDGLCALRFAATGEEMDAAPVLMQAERELVDGLKLPGLMDIDVLSPRRLMRRVRERGGRDPLAPLDSRGRAMALSQSLAMCREELCYYRRVWAQPGLPDRLSSLLGDMQRCGLTPEALR